MPNRVPTACNFAKIRAAQRPYSQCLTTLPMLSLCGIGPALSSEDIEIVFHYACISVDEGRDIKLALVWSLLALGAQLSNAMWLDCACVTPSAGKRSTAIVLISLHSIILPALHHAHVQHFLDLCYLRAGYNTVLRLISCPAYTMFGNTHPTTNLNNQKRRAGRSRSLGSLSC